MSLLGSIASGIWDNINMNSANAKAKRAATTAYNREVDFYKHRFQWATEDAAEAGINPAVAAGAPGNTPNIDPANTTKTNAPDLSQAINSAKANEIAQQNADTQENATKGQNFLNFANGIKNLKETGLMDRNTAAKEVQANAEKMKAEAEVKKVDATINRVNELLPMEKQGMALELAVKAFNNQLTAREKEVLERTGLTLSEWKGLGKEALDITKFAIGGKLAGGGKNSARNYSVDYYNRNGEVTGGKYISYH